MDREEAVVAAVEEAAEAVAAVAEEEEVEEAVVATEHLLHLLSEPQPNLLRSEGFFGRSYRSLFERLDPQLKPFEQECVNFYS